jgi:hypothetical protein
MTQVKLRLKSYEDKKEYVPEGAEVVGLSCEDETVTLRFMSKAGAWGQPARQVRIDRRLAEQLSRLLLDELAAY